uniref:AlNc14C92G5727 protein n=1 Tax=Albugo laibachii Nc14 TaxID=890382 RepID=F0WGJ3_9STRA|nr:AlNc14C92G5727 [Albugo laibachii Nc14]|eukprot:CCA20357.1 AlNc14C92G5727 [Albugo laibachii Nc14]
MHTKADVKLVNQGCSGKKSSLSKLPTLFQMHKKLLKVEISAREYLMVTYMTHDTY